MCLQSAGRRKLLCLIAMCLTYRSPAIAGAASSTLADVMPAGAIVYGELTELDALLSRVQESPHLATLLSSPQYEQWKTTDAYRKIMAGRQVIETQIGMDLWSAAKAILGGRVAVGLYREPDRRKPDVVLVIRVNDVKALAQLKQRLEPLLVLLDSNQVGASETSSGQTVYSLNVPGARLYTAIGTDWIALSNIPDRLTAVLNALAGDAKATLAGDSPYQLMSRQMGTDHLLRVFVNTAAITDAMGHRFAPDKLRNPLASLLFGGMIEMAVTSPYAGLTLDVDDSDFALTASVAADRSQLDASREVFFSAPTSSGTPALPAARTRIAGISLYRDFASWYRHREDFIRPEALPAFDKFEAGIANLLPGKDVGEDILPLMGRNVTFVAVPQNYSQINGRPGIQLPAFGLIVELAKPDEAADVFQLFFQTLASIVNLQAGQQGRQPWVMTSETYQTTQVSYARFLQKPSGDRLPIVFNFIPAAARVGNHYVVTSSLELCHQLIDELKKPQSTAKTANRNFNFEFGFAPFANALEANRDFFQAQAIQKGKSIDEARQEFDLVLQVLRYFNTLQLSTTVKPDAFQARLQGSW